jgi:hypothetical protein
MLIARLLAGADEESLHAAARTAVAASEVKRTLFIIEILFGVAKVTRRTRCHPYRMHAAIRELRAKRS